MEAWNGLVRLDDASWVTIDGWEIANCQKGLLYMMGPASVGVTVQDCDIHTKTLSGYQGFVASGLDVAGGVTQLTFTHNIVHEIQPRRRIYG